MVDKQPASPLTPRTIDLEARQALESLTDEGLLDLAALTDTLEDEGPAAAWSLVTALDPLITRRAAFTAARLASEQRRKQVEA